MNGMLTFHVSVHARPAEAVLNATPAIVDERPVQTLAVSAEQLATPFAVSFEQAGEALANLPRLFFEPDGSFVWVSARGDEPWQVDGNLFDRAGRLQFVDLKGSCPAVELDRLLAAFGWPQTAVMLQLVRAAVFLDEAEFRRVASGKMPGS
jgi:hypothetical protein